MKHLRILLLASLLITLMGQPQYSWCQPLPETTLVATTKDTAVQADTALSDSARAAFIANAARGRNLFLGIDRLENAGPSCITCHNAKGTDLPEGGLLAKDLTHVYARLGEGGIPAILGSTPFPAMATAYKNKPLTTKEMIELTAFFKDVEQTAPAGEPAPQYTTLLIGGSVGICIWMGLIFGLYYNRKKESVKKAIYDRQIQY